MQWIDEPIVNDVRVDNDGNLSIKLSDDKWYTLGTPIWEDSVTAAPYRQESVVTTTMEKYLSLDGLETYDKKMKEYIQKEIDKLRKELQEVDKKYFKVIYGE